MSSDPREDSQETELSIVMPCLDEADTLGICIKKAIRTMAELGIRGEVLVADNGSTDGSIAIAEQEGARVVRVPARGYGAALRGGIEAAHGRYVIMGDADDSYDFLEIGKFVAQLRKGYDLVMGCRLPGGGGTVLPGAMPKLHRWWGNPMLSAMVRTMYHAPIHDVYCGMRGFTRDLYRRMDLRCTGMEFATEMVVKASLFKESIAEVPITLHPDGRKAHAPHLRTFSDGWRTFRLFLLFSPRWLFMLPGLFMIIMGCVVSALALFNLQIGRATFDAHTLLFGNLFVIIGYQAIMFGVFTKMFAISEKLLPPAPWLVRLLRLFPLERCLVIATTALLAGLVSLGHTVFHWHAQGFSTLSYSQTMRWVIPAFTAVALGFQTLLSSFFISVLGLKHR